MNSRLRGVLQVALAAICYGFTGVFGKQAFAAGLGIGDLLALRYLFSAIVLAIFFCTFARNSFRLAPRQWLLSFTLGALNCTLSSLLYFTAIQGLSIALAALLLYTFPLWALFISFMQGDRISARQAAGTTIALLGLLLLLWGEIRFASWHSVAAGVGAGLSYAIYMTIVGRFQRATPALGSGFWVIAGTAVTFLLAYHPRMMNLAHWTPSEWGSLLGLVVVGTILPILLVQAGLQRLSATEAAVFSLLEPVTAVVSAGVLFGERLSHRQQVGAFLILLSLILLSRSRAAPATA